MANKNSRISVKKKPAQVTKNAGKVKLKGVTRTGKKVSMTAGDKNSQVLAATVGGAVLGNLIIPGIGGAIFGGFVGALLGNGSRGKGGK